MNARRTATGPSGCCFLERPRAAAADVPTDRAVPAALSALVTIRAASAHDLRAWAGLQGELWPDQDHDARGHVTEALQRADAGNFLAFGADGTAIGFAEATLRNDYVNGTDSSPVAFLEGWYVNAGWRGQGIGRALLSAVRQWAQAQGCSELASDAALDNLAAQRAHAACGFAETERVVYFRMALDDDA
ncbi:GNAT family N-acetyltransferase [Pseudoxanthomonas winnipegensis]|jgi:aminoglycoside 6'-N-acetyltransferase I|uniref:GNAT family N-acetyltransferase n=1 Tax=Pseudoxanthomonas winnipegensis TaxID=2480810 RepID=A0A4Q8LE99_9GAMM|nr:MAG: N-acetyltransferase [Pseudoxanthomonas spadix]TAA27071.1 GNAT family N-acetyltransferase [Pseudoxanthomonas winnipegensis]